MVECEGNFRESGHAVLRGLIAPEVAERMMKQLWTDLREQDVQIFTPPNDLVGMRSIEVHGTDYVPFSHFHWGLTPAIEVVVGAGLLPSYCHFRIYPASSVCRVHSDRKGSEISVSLTLAYSDGLPWELSLGTRKVVKPAEATDDFGDEPTVSIALGVGDALVYPGTGVRHGRLTPNPNRWSGHLFLMWVKRGGEHESKAFEVLDRSEG